MFAVFNLCIFTSAFLLFLIQPMVANILLPKVGGSPNIWNTCSVFFQLSLLLGYLYSYLVSKKLSLKKQISLHCFLLFCALWAVNFHFKAEAVDMSTPIMDTLWLLFRNIFFPFMLLSTTSPLIQHWLATSNLKENKNPYILYVCSNIGSLLALYAYPLVFEKQLAVSLQGFVWHIVFIGFFLCVLAIGLYLSKSQVSLKAEAEVKTKSKVNPISIFYWIFFAFVPSSLMLGVTNHLSTDIGGLPFLWILPLSLYLLSFIWTFSRFYTNEVSVQIKRLYKISALIAVFLFYNLTLSSKLVDNITFIGIHCFIYFIFATFCHGILSQKKPAPENLTLFYLCLAIGGALGGAFNTFVAPYLFTSIEEYPFIIVLSLPFVLSNLTDTKTELVKITRNVAILAIIITVFASLNIKLSENIAHILFYTSILVLLMFVFSSKKSFIFLCVFSCIFTSLFFNGNSNIIFKKRNFFGTISIKQDTFFEHVSLSLYHGNTLHGRQKLINQQNEQTYLYDPHTYYGKRAAVEDFFKIYDRKNASIAWLGLGSGAIICYAEDKSSHHIFEINQDIVDISKKYRYFRYLEKCAPEAKITIGDARIEMQKEENNKYDLIVVDVFSSHFIPVHLTTKEAIEVYRSKLKKDGLILFHISSRAFDIEPILTKIASHSNMTFIVRDRKDLRYRYPQWGVLSNDKKHPDIIKLLSLEGWREGKTDNETSLWTDDFHNLLSALRH